MNPSHPSHHPVIPTSPWPVDRSRKIIHFDMDAFFVSVEVRDAPHLQGKPIVVGGPPESRAVVCSASYEARRFGVRSAMPCAQAARLCPGVQFISPNFEKYNAASEEIHRIFHEVTPRVEPLSLDEAYLDVTENSLGEPLARVVARHLKDRIKKETGLTGSAGVAPNKFLAKIASDLKKPDGLVVLGPDQIPSLLSSLPVEKLWGVGPATTQVLHALGLRTTQDVQRKSPEFMSRHLGKHGLWIHQLSFGYDPREVETEWEPKSRGAERTFASDLTDWERLEFTLEQLSEQLAESLALVERTARTLTLKVRYDDFTTHTRSRTTTAPLSASEAIRDLALELLRTKTQAGERPIRLLGLSASSFCDLKGRPIASQKNQDLPWTVPGEAIQLEFQFPDSRG